MEDITWQSIEAMEAAKRAEALASRTFEQWRGMIRNIIDYTIETYKPAEWLVRWEGEVFPRIKAQNREVGEGGRVAEEDINMMFHTACGDRREEMEKKVSDSEEGKLKKMFKDKKTEGTYALAAYMVRRFNIITVGEKEREMYIYQNGAYFRSENETIYPEIQRVLGDQTTRLAKNETFHKIADMTACPRTIFTTTDMRYIPLANGVYDLEGKVLLEHSPGYRFIYQFPVKYDGEARCDRTLAFLGDVLTEDQTTIIQEWIGYYFYRLYMFKKAVIFVGEGDTGKTTLLEVIMYLLGKENVSSVSLHKMTSDKFAAAHLYGKHGNLVDELSARDISDTGNFKIATGGGSISGEYKFGNQFSFLNFAKFTFACNKIPDVEDFDDEAYFGRWMVLRFGKTIENKIPNFIAQLATDSERSGLFNWAMLGLERLRTNGKFSYNKNAMDIKQEMMRSGSSIAMFCSEGIEEKNGDEISKEDLYEAYSRFCIARGLATETIKMLGTKFLFYVKYASEGLITNTEAKRVRGWRNVKVIKDESKTDEELEALASAMKAIQ
jgi:P4 family phage/plasmid primase-like protien